MSLSVSPMVQKKLLIDSAISALVEIFFPSIFSDEILSKRESNGAYNQLMAELRVNDINSFRRYLVWAAQTLK